MNAEQIIQEVNRYIDDTVYNYAVLIDGEWGCGKTYFAKHAIKESIEKHKGEHRIVKYVSLYGCNSVEDIQENLVWELAEEARLILKSKRKRKKYIQNESEREAIWDTAIASTKKIVDAIAKKLFPDVPFYNISWEWLKLNSCVIIFDDLERCNCNLNEVFGFINGLVEHEGIKVILVSNEKDIYMESSPKRLEQQYLVALNDRVLWPELETDSFLSGTRNNKNGITIAELEHRRKNLFKPSETNEDYKKTREKLIGITMHYDADIPKIIRTLI